jgi:heme exporter protein B
MWALLKRDLRRAVKNGTGPLTGMLFYLAIIMVAPFAVGPDLNLLAQIGPALLWIGALLASLLGLDAIFQHEQDDGSLDLFIMQSENLALFVLIKCLSHWLVYSLPLLIIAPVLALFLNMTPLAIGATLVTLFVGMPAITFIGALGAAITVRLVRGGLILAIIILPFTLPILIFGASATYAALEDPAPFMPPFLILCAITLIFLVIGSIASAAALRFSNQ